MTALSAALLLGNAAAARAGTTGPVPGGTEPSAPPRPAASAEPHGPGAAPTPPAEPTPVPAPDSAWTAEDAVRFWTPERMAAATDPAGRAAPPKTAVAARQPGSVTGMTAQHFKGIKSVGTIFSTSAGLKGHRCSASVVRSSGHNLILTAGHCVGANSMFVPMYDHTKSAAQQPYGVWAVDKWFRDKRYASDKSKNSDLDYAFASLKPAGSKKVQEVVGANALARTPGYANKVTVVGYPKVAHNPQDQPVRCPHVSTTALSGYYQMQIDCAGMWGGVSGGPWFSALDASGNTGTITGNVGGFMQGGPDVPQTDHRYNEISYSPLYGDRFFKLYADAQQGRNPDYGPYRQPRLPYTMGAGAAWKHVKLMASGDFRGNGHSDMVAIRDDGGVTLYDSDGKGRFTGERRLLGKNDTWKHAVTVTAGDFAGSDQFDLLVRWSDGEVTLYGDVADKGLNRAGTQMIKPNATWKKATQIAAGRFGSSAHVTDLIVRWADGEVTLYTGVGAGNFGHEHKLKDANSTWRSATLLTAGEYSGNARWDLMVRWTDGELDQYAGTGTSGLGKEQRLLNKNALWTHDTVMTTGEFTGNGRTDDLVVRWSDGETTMYTDTRAAHLGTEDTLVHAACC
ncbi:trypsin-like serine peptidase [Streptomyces sp. NPDC100445]|uniref:trypsin-like serine peptidase n=1 Tax=Streptomyces sp. NPDC100445 TaxID=3366102 RepID=UPI0037FC79AA